MVTHLDPIRAMHLLMCGYGFPDRDLIIPRPHPISWCSPLYHSLVCTSLDYLFSCSPSRVPPIESRCGLFIQETRGPWWREITFRMNGLHIDLFTGDHSSLPSFRPSGNVQIQLCFSNGVPRTTRTMIS